MTPAFSFFIATLLLLRVPAVSIQNALSQEVSPRAQAEENQRPQTSAIAKWKKAVNFRPSGRQSYVKLNAHSNEDGIPADISETFSSMDRFASRTVRQFDSQELVFAPNVKARKDPNGFVRVLMGDELKRYLTDAFLERALFFGPDSGASIIEASGDEKDAHLVRLVVMPAGGKRVTWYIDRQTSLPVRSEYRGQDSTITHAYADWKTFEQVRVPTSIRISETNKADFTWELVSAEFPRSVASSQFAAPTAAPSDAILSADAPPIPFTMEADHIVVKVSVNGSQPIGFIFDTGDDQESLNSKYLKDFQLEPYARSQATGGGNTTDYLYAKDATFSWPGVELKKQHVGVLDETGLERALGMKIGGLLGYDFISRFVVEIDYEKKLIYLHDPKKWKYHGRGATIPLTFDGGVPFTSATISAKSKTNLPGYFAVDFGAQETMTLTSPFATSNDLYPAPPNDSNVNKPTGLEKQFFAQQNVRGRIDDLRIGALDIRSIPVNMSANTSGAYASEDFSGTIGEGIFKRYRVFLDYQRSRMILEPTPAANGPFPERKTYGLSILASGDELHIFTVTAVRTGSPAEKDGFAKSDTIVSLDGREAQKITLRQIGEALRQEGKSHEVTIERGGALKTVTARVKLISLER